MSTPATFPMDIVVLIEEISRLQTHLDSANSENKRLRQTINVLINRSSNKSIAMDYSRKAADKGAKWHKKKAEAKKAASDKKKAEATRVKAHKKAEREAKKASKVVECKAIDVTVDWMDQQMC